MLDKREKLLWLRSHQLVLVHAIDLSNALSSEWTRTNLKDLKQWANFIEPVIESLEAGEVATDESLVLLYQWIKRCVDSFLAYCNLGHEAASFETEFHGTRYLPFQRPISTLCSGILPDGGGISRVGANQGVNERLELDVCWVPVGGAEARLDVTVINLDGMSVANEDGRVRFALFPIFTDNAIDFQSDQTVPKRPNCRFIRAAGYKEDIDLDLARSEISRAVQEAANCKADVLLMPELTMAPDLVQHLKECLLSGDGYFPAICVAGSWHHSLEGKTNGEYTNRSTVFDGRGNVLWVHDKIVSFHGHDSRNGYKIWEPSISGKKAIFAEIGGLGLAFVAICSDLICDPGNPMGDILTPILRATFVNTLLVPSMQNMDRLDVARLRAEMFRTSNAAATIYCNALGTSNETLTPMDPCCSVFACPADSKGADGTVQVRPQRTEHEKLLLMDLFIASVSRSDSELIESAN